MAATAGVSPSSFPQSSTGRFEVMIVLARLCRRMITSSRSSAAVGGQLAHAQIVDDEQWHRFETAHQLLAGGVDGGVGDLFQQDVGLAVEDAVSLENGGHADGLGEVALTRTGRAEKQAVLAVIDEVGGGKLEDGAAVHLLVEVEVEAVESFVGLAKLGLLDAPREQTVGAPGELVGDQGGEEVEMGEWSALGFEDAGLEALGHGAEAQLVEGALNLGDVHGVSSSGLVVVVVVVVVVMRSIRSR